MKTLRLLLGMLLGVGILFILPTESHAQWQPDVRLTNDPAGSWTSPNNAWCIASSSSVVHVVWEDNRDGNAEIYYKRSTDAGVTWPATDTRLTNNPALSSIPSVAVTGSVVHAAWYDSRDGNAEIYYKRSTDAGVNWGTDTRLTINLAISSYPSVAVSDSFVHVVWEDYRDGNGEIYYKRSTDGGVSWGLDTRLTNNAAISILPSVAVSGSFVHVVWRDNRDGNYEIYYKRSTDGGVTWPPTDTRLTNDPASSGTPSITISSSVLHAVWFDLRDGNNEIYYKRSTDGGINWGADTRLTNDAASSGSSSITISSSVVHVVWTDSRNGNTEIYYKRDPTGNPTSVITLDDIVPGEYKLFQNYPNPFNPSTRIRFSVRGSRFEGDGSGFKVHGSSVVTLKVYDMLGREVRTLVNENLQPRSYEATFDADGLASGVYFYRLTAGGFTESKRMVLLR